jgi:putative tryptophan/tyrosine transport system substrate-binding protein
MVSFITASGATMRRREFISLLCSTAVVWPAAARAQPAGAKIPRIGVLWHAESAAGEGSNYTALVQGFKNLGYIDGRNIVLEHRFPNEEPDRFRSMAAELVASKIDVLIGVGNNAAPYAKAATATIPVVFILVADPVGTKLVASLPRPGGNTTGLSNAVVDLIGKRLELLKEIIPTLARVAMLSNPAASVSRHYVDVTRAEAARLGLAAQIYEWRSPDELEPVFTRMVGDGMQALITNPDGIAFTHRARIAAAARAHHIPLSTWSRETFKAGALMAYGADGDAICHRAAVLVEKILKGTRPDEIPVEQPTKFELLINLATARDIGLKIPESFLLRADDVIE